MDQAIRWLKGKPPGWVVADLGCGDAKIAATVQQVGGGALGVAKCAACKCSAPVCDAPVLCGCSRQQQALCSMAVCWLT